MSSFGRFHGKNNHELVQYLKDSKRITSDRVFRTMQSVDRGNYTNDGQAYLDAPQNIGYGVNTSAPHMHAFTLQLLEEKLREGGRALDIGSGSGYLTACFALMLGEQGVAVGIEHIADINDKALENIKKDHSELLDSGRVKLVVGDGRMGWPQEGPYDVIQIGAATNEIPQALIDQLAPGGRMLVPVGPERSNQTLMQFDKMEDGKVRRKSLMGVIFSSLSDKERQGRS